MSTPDEIRARRSDVEQVVRAGKWSLSTQRVVAKKYGVTLRTIRKDKQRLVEAWRQDVTPEHFDALEFLARLHGVIDRAIAKDQLGPAVRALELEAQVCAHREGIDVVRGGTSGVAGSGPARSEDAARRLRAALEVGGEE